MTQIIDLGKLRFNFNGDFNAATAYERNDVVAYGGNIYCYVAQLKEAGNLPSDTNFWAMMVKGVNFMSYAGPFNPATAYLVGDVVQYGPNLFRAKLNTVAGDLPTVAAKWDMVTMGLRVVGAWATTVAYFLNDIVNYGGNSYLCAAAHTSGAFGTDLTAVKWKLLAGGVRFRGAWAATTAYLANDIITDSLSTYLAPADCTSGAVSAAADLAAGKLTVLAQGQSNVPVPAGQPDGKVITTLNGAYVLADGKPKVAVINANTALVDGFSYMLDSSAGSFNGTLPAAPAPGARVVLEDGGGNLQGFPVTVLRNGSNVNGIADDLLLNSNGISLKLTYINATIGWRIS